MSFRRVAVLAAALVAGAAMAQDAPPTPASAASTAKAAAAASPARAASAAAAASTAGATSAAGAASSPAKASSVTLTAANVTSAGPLSGDADAGQGKAAVCGACHGPDGNSTDPQYPKLAGQNEHYIVQQLEHFKSGQRQNAIMMGMAAPLSVTDMHDIGAYYADQKIKPGVADQKLAEAGSKIFREGDAEKGIPACMSCHGPDGHGNPGAPYPQVAGQHAQYVEQVLTAWHDGETWGSDKHAQIMPSIAKKLSKQDITAVASYIEGLHTNAPDAASASE